MNVEVTAALRATVTPVMRGTLYASVMNSSISKNGKEILDLEDWRLRAGPKRSMHWKDGRSAKESAKSWLASRSFPPELLHLIESHEDFGTIEEWYAEPEAPVRIDDFRGEPPNIDVLVRAKDRFGPIAIVVEAKADEAFGALVEETLKDAQTRLEKTPNSKGKERLERLTHALLGRKPEDDEVRLLRYQLFTACGAALAEAERIGATRAVVLVHEFVSEATKASKRSANSDDLRRFIQLISSEQAALSGLSGPLQVPCAPLTEAAINLYIGKGTSDVRGGGV